MNSKNSIDKEYYKDYIKIYNKILKKAESDYYSSTFNNKLNSSKKIWKEINSICSSGSKRNSAPSNIAKLVINGKTVTDATQMANELNHYFSNVGLNLANN